MSVTRRQFTVGAGAAFLAVASGRQALCAQEVLRDVRGKLERIEAGTGGRLGVSAIDTGSGRTVTYRADERFPMCSTAKLLGCGAVLSRVDAELESLDRHIRFTADDLMTYSPATKEHVGGDGMTLDAICRAALTLSDNTAANLIVASLGGPASVTAFARSLGDPVTRLDRMEPALNEATPGDPRDTTTPNAMAGDLRALVLGDALSPRSRATLAGWMVANTTGDAKLRAGMPQNWRVGDKTGSGDHGSSNDVAVLWPPDRPPLVVAVYLTGAESVTETVRSASIAAVGRAVAAELAS